ncbi:methylenetetrahydrofolate reductase [NAD(P)H] [Desulforamulus hydrothermalis]|uniref:Methylenetetrahydrofolate reductase n=1 Tax=Desulforamulus hydrothermalis Lam5 = DSM 18033 TaxID=1121428 RepID=K8DWV4_9FIRM|nr:methylenetetrahydrofolate reductase [NAD(P)H] [Desulforamulus hydrothermalis]CCO06962.1 5,10-methylenetetrahydrofolate reductase [Desulforamulus hydrothermalis Lam5 = DSM 18033]SHG98700.1 5,10-methylenetetrahydrofolate reductase (NAD(P)) [Desulforamulus hydrothermalis Lam5 = DSM 18033]
MKIAKLFATKQPVISFEIFPPKADTPVETIFTTLEGLIKLKPDFISVTYGAGGSSRSRTKEIASRIKNHYRVETLAHLTCVGHEAGEIDMILQGLQEANIENVLALRGDPPADNPHYDFTKGAFSFASDLISHIKKHNNFCIAAAAYPEGHAHCRRLSEDLNHLKYKVDQGVDFLITQLFFDNRIFYNFMENARRIGIACPVMAGVMPVLNAKQIKRIISLCGASMPAKLLMMVDKYGDRPEDMEKAGIEYASQQVLDLMENGVEGIHLYTMNKPRQITEILCNTGRVY